MQKVFSKRKFKFWKVCTHPLTIGLMILLTDHPSFTSVSPFETTQTLSQKNRHRLPASTESQVIKIDCSQIENTKMYEQSTAFETVRIEAKNCGQSLSVNNSQLKFSLSTFATGNSTFSTEYAYLVKGENTFSIATQGKSYALKIVRF